MALLFWLALAGALGQPDQELVWGCQLSTLIPQFSEWLLELPPGMVAGFQDECSKKREQKLASFVVSSTSRTRHNTASATSCWSEWPQAQSRNDEEGTLRDSSLRC